MTIPRMYPSIRWSLEVPSLDVRMVIRTNVDGIIEDFQTKQQQYPEFFDEYRTKHLGELRKRLYKDGCTFDLRSLA